MKIRLDYVTNSSSSSFIIDKAYVDYETLKDILLQIANLEEEYVNPGENLIYTEDDISPGCVAYRYYIEELTDEHPCRDKYTHHYYIHNKENVRYSWAAIDKVLQEHRIPYSKGYTD